MTRVEQIWTSGEWRKVSDDLQEEISALADPTPFPSLTSATKISITYGQWDRILSENAMLKYALAKLQREENQNGSQS